MENHARKYLNIYLLVSNLTRKLNSMLKRRKRHNNIGQLGQHESILVDYQFRCPHILSFTILFETVLDNTGQTPL